MEALTAESIGSAIRTRRDELGLTQTQLATLAGFPAPQTISEIEKGRREVKAHELARFANALHTDIDVLLGIRPGNRAPRILWRRGFHPKDATKDAQLLERAHRYAQLEEWCGEPPAQPLPNVVFDPASATWTSVASLAEQMRRLFDLGSIPAAGLRRTLEDCYGVKIFFEPLEGNQAGACVRGEFGAAVLLNSANVPWRQNFSLAHELFHLVTWDAVEAAWEREALALNDEPGWYEQLEKFANHFASHLLLPAESLLPRIQAQIDDGKISYHKIVSVARDFEVSVEALLYRLCDLGRVKRTEVESAIRGDEIRQISRHLFQPLRRGETSWYPDRFKKLAARAYQRGAIGKAIVAKYLELSYAEVELLDLGDPYGSQAALSLG